MAVGAQHRSRAVLGRCAPFELGDRLLFVRTEDRQAGGHYCLNGPWSLVLGPWSLVTMDEGRRTKGPRDGAIDFRNRDGPKTIAYFGQGPSTGCTLWTRNSGIGTAAPALVALVGAAAALACPGTTVPTICTR